MAAGRSEIEYVKYKFFKDMYRGDRPNSEASTSAPNSRPASARQRETPRSSRPATPAWSSAPSRPDDPPWPRPPLFSAPNSRPLFSRPASASSRGERPRLRAEAAADVAAIAAFAASEAGSGAHASAPSSARRTSRPASAPVSGRRGCGGGHVAESAATTREQHLHYQYTNMPPAHGSIYADRGPYPGPGNYYRPEDAEKALMKGHKFNHSARPTEEHFIKEDVGPFRPAGHARSGYKQIPKFSGGTSRDKPVSGASFARSRRM